MKTPIINSVIIAIALISSAVLFKIGIDNFSTKDRYVSVKGLAEMEVPANHIIYPIVFKEVGNNLIELNNIINKKNETIVQFIQNQGISPTDITIGAPQVIDMDAERYNNEQNSYRYNVTSVISISTTDVEKVKTLMSKQSELLEKGIATTTDYRFQTLYEFTELNDIKPQMIEEATKNARTSAEKFAADSESKLGEIRTANQGQFSIEDRDYNTPDIKRIRVVTTLTYYIE